MIFLKWDKTDIAWDKTKFTWDEAILVAEIIAGANSTSNYVVPPLSPEKKKKFIKLMCKIEGIEYKETKEIKKRRIRITDVELAAREVLGIDIKINL